MNRTLNVVRLQLVNRQTFIWIPAIILGVTALITLAVYVIIHSATGGDNDGMYGGGLQAPLWYFFAIGIYALTLTFPFSQAMSVTRREFYVGTLLTAAATALGMAIVFVVGGLIEAATGGWGMNGYFFHLPWIWESGPLAAGLFFFVVAMGFFVIGFWGATVYKRFGPMGLTIALVLVAVVLLAAVWLITQTGSWPAVWGWLVTSGVLALTLWAALLVVVLAGSSFAMFRRLLP
jgi:hypothetical protein